MKTARCTNQQYFVQRNKSSWYITSKYLCFAKTPDARCYVEISKRIAKPKDTFSKMMSIFRNRNLGCETKMRALKPYILSILLYGCECWTLTEYLERNLETAEMWYIRKIMKISWTEKKSNK